MASSVAVALLLNIVFFTLVSANCPPPPPPPPTRCPPTPSAHHPPPPPTSHHHSPPKTPTCGLDTLKLKVCANVLDLVNISLGPKSECCALIRGLVDLEAAVCLCTALRADILGIRLDIPLSLSLLLNNCHREVPNGYECA